MRRGLVAIAVLALLLIGVTACGNSTGRYEVVFSRPSGTGEYDSGVSHAVLIDKATGRSWIMKWDKEKEMTVWEPIGFKGEVPPGVALLPPQ